MRTLQNLEMHEELRISSKLCGNDYWIMRVPGGWLYSSNNYCTFVPYCDDDCDLAEELK